MTLVGVQINAEDEDDDMSDDDEEATLAYKCLRTLPRVRTYVAALPYNCARDVPP